MTELKIQHLQYIMYLKHNVNYVSTVDSTVYIFGLFYEGEFRLIFCFS